MSGIYEKQTIDGEMYSGNEHHKEATGVLPLHSPPPPARLQL